MEKEFLNGALFLCQKFGGFIPIAYLCDKKNELAAHVRLGNSSVYFNSETQLLSSMAGRTLRGMLSTADYKDGKALKSCHTEFVHIYGAAFFT
ncbi:hypothetical protein DWX56_15755 [Parabacteroides merdae]|uniref:Uncharacterized protein n=3 Tax=Bacteroidales TaxID=171549 RepID=A0A3R6B827_9BACT|nr:hypothetical protein [Parabacteroides merdae]MTU29055.1 hypothetical protein [Parabacteroides merdae]RGS98139.1 hypothetical protein DWX56_15755 [Parabacteroides merdae]RYS84517.1 hypothetical protein EAJ15_05445 [Parabacteroides merdae]